MIRTLCDRCSQEILGMGYTVTSGVKMKFDLCPECYKAFEKFMKGEEGVEQV